jgi:hypothetical protein
LLEYPCCDKATMICFSYGVICLPCGGIFWQTIFWPNYKKFLLEQFGGVWTLKDTKNIQFVRRLRFHLSTERKENDFVDQLLYIILSPRTPVFLPLPLRGKFSSDPRTRRLLRNLLNVLLFLPVISAIL